MAETKGTVEIIEPQQTKITDWYDKLVSRCKKLQFTTLVRFYWNLGDEIIKDYEKFGKPEYGSNTTENLSKDLQIGVREIQKSIQFRTLYTEWRDVVSELEGKSWRYIYREVLPEHKPPKENIMMLPNGRYQIIYADPAWKYWSGGWKNQEQHYTTMDLEDIKKLPIQDISDENCILFLWATFPYIKETLEVMESWGFKYSTLGFIWVKKTKTGKKPFHFGCGGWTRANVEPCFIGVKGSIERKDASISQIVYEPVMEHSKKPDIIRDKIVKLVGDLPRIELFARQQIKGWDSWGDEI